jgi:hypothetical protein
MSNFESKFVELLENTNLLEQKENLFRENTLDSNLSNSINNLGKVLNLLTHNDNNNNNINGENRNINVLANIDLVTCWGINKVTIRNMTKTDCTKFIVDNSKDLIVSMHLLFNHKLLNIPYLIYY